MKRISTVVIALVLVLSIFTPKNVQAADDITGHYFENSMRTLIKMDIMSGYDDGTYRPDRLVTRAEFTTFLVRALDLSSTSSTSPFTDVKKGDWYFWSVMSATSSGLIGGYPDNSFRPNNKISRQEMAAMIIRALDYKGISAGQAPLEFADNSKINPMFRGAIQQLLYLDVIAGKKSGDNVYFAPLDSTTRGETSAILLRMLNVIENPQEFVNYTNYTIDFQNMISKQVSANPKVDGAGIYRASRDLVAYYLNPNNFSRGTSSYLQFLSLSQSTGLKVQELNEKVLAGKGILEGHADAFIEAGQRYGINEVYLISHALHETGNGTSKLATGIKVNGKMTYNMFGVGARDECPNTCGAQRAYDEGWFTPRAAIIGGAKFIGKNYVNAGQDTLYKMRWNPYGLQKEGYATHQYATHVSWAVLQTNSIQKIYNLLDTYVLKFDVPTFNDQPGPTERPTGVDQYYVDRRLEGEKGKTTATIGLNFRTGPTTNFGVIKKLPFGTEVTLIGENGGWYKMKVDGQKGWASGKYISLQNVTKANIASINDATANQEKPKEIEETTDIEIDAKAVVEDQNKETTPSTQEEQEAKSEDPLLEEDDEKENNETESSLDTKVENKNSDKKKESKEIQIDFTKHEGIMGEVNIDEVTLRNEPITNDSSSILKTLQANTIVEVLDEKDGWYLVKIDEEQGWVLSETITVLNVLKPDTTDKPFVIKAEASTESETIGHIAENDLIILALNNEGKLINTDGWYKIVLKDTNQAWVRSTNIKTKLPELPLLTIQ
ncbi:S-layer homology domain-containing protein [Virgibacillus necropolis]|uniref:S-layer homology domain-containing protein n=1 Tax=Virgibacillus necropolis TaxID=163877 RepID=UPI003850A709